MGWQTPNRPTLRVDESGSAGKQVSLSYNAHLVSARTSDSTRCDYRKFAFDSKDLHEVLSNATGNRCGIDLGLNHDAPAD
jgi:hypothetical protein